MKKIVLANCGTLEPSTLSALKDKCTELGYELVEEEKLKVELPEEKVYTIMQPPPLPDITMLDSPVSNCKKRSINVFITIEQPKLIRNIRV